MAKEQEPRWDSAPAPGFKPDGESLIAPPGEVKNVEEKIEFEGQLFTPAEFETYLASIQDRDGENDDNGDDSDLEEDDLLEGLDI